MVPTIQENIALRLVARALQDLPLHYPKPLARTLTYAEQIPPNTLTPEMMRAVIRYELEDLERAFALEQHVVSQLKVCGVAFLDWEADPSLVGKVEPPPAEPRFRSRVFDVRVFDAEKGDWL